MRDCLDLDRCLNIMLTIYNADFFGDLNTIQILNDAHCFMKSVLNHSMLDIQLTK